jgi:hypothetical protein
MNWDTNQQKRYWRKSNNFSKDFEDVKTINTFARTIKKRILSDSLQTEALPLLQKSLEGEVGEWLKPPVC